MMYLKVKNYKRFQSADIVKKSEGRPPWVKQWREFWIDYDISQQRADTRLLALFLVSFASEFLKEFPGEDEMGTFPHDVKAISRRSSLPVSSVTKGIQTLLDLGFLGLNLSRELSRENSRQTRPLEVEVEVERGRENGRGSRDADAAFLETPDDIEHELRRLLEVLTDKDANTEHTLRKYARQLPVGAIAKVRESSKGKQARYACAALKDEVKVRKSQ